MFFWHINLLVKIMKCTLDIPYPKIQVMEKNPILGKRISHSYAGDVSEDTAIHQYLFQSMMLKNQNDDISNILEEIAKVEMKHLEVLGLLMKELGIYPVYYDSSCGNHAYFTSKYAPYDTDLESMLLSNIMAERRAILQYDAIISSTSDIYVQNILKRIVLDERLHLEIFEKILFLVQKGET